MSRVGDRRSARRWRHSITALVAVLALLPVLIACNPDKKAQEKASADGMIANLNGGSFGGGTNPQRNFNPYSPTALTSGYTFESLFQVNDYNCQIEPWLGTKYTWSDDTHLAVDIRNGVQWSDGKPFTAADVAYTFDLLKKVPAFDTTGAWESLTSVQAQGADKVVFTLKAPSSSTLQKVVSVLIVPQHIWSKVKAPEKFTNPDGIGTGPFTVKAFNGQQLLLARNAKYWQADKVKVKQLTFSSNGGGGDADKLRLANGEYDWNQMFIADIDKTFVSRDKDHNKYWFPPGADISLFMNLTKAPFDDLGFRKAISYAIDREAIAKRAEYGYVEPASQTGLILPGQKDWLSPKYQDGVVLPFDPAKAKDLFEHAGYKYDSSGRLLGSDGTPMSFSFKVQAGYLDWIQAAQIIKDNLKQVGITLDVRTAAPADVENDRAIGAYDMEFGVPPGGCNMFQNYDDALGSERTAPIGKPAPANFIRWKDGHTDRLLQQLNQAIDVTAQKKVVAKLQDIMVQQLPQIPLWYGATWFEYRTETATGWPSAQDPYAGPNDALIIMTKLRPANG